MNFVERSNRFGRHDRLLIEGQAYRVVGKTRRTFVLQLVTDNFITDHFTSKTDAEINALFRNGRLKYDRDHFSKALGLLRQRHDDSDLSDLSEEDLRTITWKTEWCVRFNRSWIDRSAAWRPTKSLPDLDRFIQSQKDSMDRWYLDKFGERRCPGRHLKGRVRKEFDYPSSSTLRNWLQIFRESDERMEAFRPAYSRCGNRNQMDPRVPSIVDRCVALYATSLKPRMRDIYEHVESELYEMNASLPDNEHAYVSATAVRRRIHKIDPFITDVGREGPDRALRKYTPVGRGLSATRPLQRVEIDDWEFDLHTLITASKQWKNLPSAKKRKVPRARCIATVAIDVASRCIVGFQLSRLAPSAPGSKSALYSVMIDKSARAGLTKCRSDWPMYGRPDYISTDGGPAFQGDFIDAVRLSGLNRVMPDMDPRMRGTIEAFFRLFKRLCRYFAGQSFANVVEKGDYPAEEMASMTFEKTYMAAVQFIVDSYHHRPHRGLEGATPYGEWQRLSDKYGVPQPPSSRQLFLAFGYTCDRHVDKHGIQCLTLSYNSPALAILHTKVGRRRLKVYVDPHDLGSVLVVVPSEFRSNPALRMEMDGDCLLVPCVDNVGRGVSFEEHLRGRREVLDLAKAEELAGRPFRLGAHRDLFEAGERARRDAGLDEFGTTQKQFEALVAAFDQKQRAAFSAPQYASSPQPQGKDAGELVAKMPRRKSKPKPAPSQSQPEQSDPSAPVPNSSNDGPKPFSSSINLYGDEE